MGNIALYYRDLLSLHFLFLVLEYAMKRGKSIEIIYLIK